MQSRGLSLIDLCITVIAGAGGRQRWWRGVSYFGMAVLPPPQRSCVFQQRPNNGRRGWLRSHDADGCAAVAAAQKSYCHA